MDYSRKDLADRLAAAYALGTLRGAARRRFEALLPAHPALRAAELAWQQRLMPLSLSLRPVNPSPAVWQHIEARVFGGPRSAPSTRRTTPPQVLPPAPVVGWWGRLAVWRGLSAVAGVAALTLAVLLVQPRTVPPPIIVVLSPAAGGDAAVSAATFVASISGDGSTMVTRPLRQVNVEVSRALELWAVPPEGAPRSLGLIAAGAATVVKRDRLLNNAAALAVSLEPAGGSPTGAPTGPILFVGKLTS
jgi:anti-sigma-K factor RskA